MPKYVFEKYATELARTAIEQKEQPQRVKQAFGYEDVTKFLNSSAGRYAVGGLGGAGLGALVGAMQPRKKGRNALYYGTMGGLGGLGLAGLVNNYSKQPKPPPQKTQYEAMFDNPNTTPGQILAESFKNPLDAMYRSATVEVPKLYDEAKRKLPGAIAETAHNVNDWRIRTGNSIGENYLYPALQYFGWLD